jgi:hypothetical protein
VYNVSGGKIDGEVNRSTTNQTATLDLQTLMGEAVHATKWVCDFKFDMLTLGLSSGYQAITSIYLTDLASGASNGSHSNQDAMGMAFQDGTSNQTFKVTYSNGSVLATSAFTTVTSVKAFYIRMIRNGDNIKIQLFNDSARTDLIEQHNYDQSGVTGLRYFKVGNYNTTVGSWNGSGTFDIDDFVFYNGVSSLTSKPTNVQDNSILVEKDTAKRYWGSLASETTASDSVTDTSGGQTLYSGSNIISAEKFTVGANIIGKVISKVEFPIYKQGTGGGGTATAGVFDSSGNTLFTFGTLLASTVADYATPFTWYSFENLTGYEIEAGHYIGLKYDAGDSSNRLVIRTDDASPPYADGVHSHFTSSWADETGIDQSFKAYSKTGYAWTRDKYTAWYEQAIRDNSVALNGVSGRPYIFGHQNNTGSSKDTKSVTFLLTKYGTGGNGTLTARIYNSSGALQHTSTNSILVSSITGLMGSTFESVTFNFTGATTENTWVVCLHTTGDTSGDNFVAAGVDIVTGVTHRVMTGSTSFTTYTDRLITITIKGDN